MSVPKQHQSCCILYIKVRRTEVSMYKNIFRTFEILQITLPVFPTFIIH